MRKQRSGLSQGFTLIELAIVVSVIALIIGGILIGKSLERNARVNNAIGEYDRFKTATSVFKDKYHALPGDFSSATSVWGQAGANPGCRTTIGTLTATCDGDGDGAISYSATNSNEWFRFWQQLANEKLIPGSYTGIGYGAGNLQAQPKVNIPGSDITSAGWTAYTQATMAGDASYFGRTYGNSFLLGRQNTNAADKAALTPQEALFFDTKIDDGMPGLGKVVAIYWSTCSQAATNTATTAAYKISDEPNQCALIITQAY